MPLTPGMCRLCTVRRAFGRPLSHWSCLRGVWFPRHLTGEPLYGDARPLHVERGPGGGYLYFG